MEEDLTGEVGGQSHPDHGLAEDYDGRRWGEGKAGTSQGEALCGRRRRDWRAEDSFYSAGKGPNCQSLDSMSSHRIGRAEDRASGSHHSHGAEEAREDSPAEGSQVCGNL